jgi:hypothetical protein
LKRERLTIFKENFERLVYLPYISKYYFSRVWLLRQNSYVGNIYNWRIEDHVVLVAKELIFGRRVTSSTFKYVIVYFIQINKIHCSNFITSLVCVKTKCYLEFTFVRTIHVS